MPRVEPIVIIPMRRVQVYTQTICSCVCYANELLPGFKIIHSDPKFANFELII